MIKIDQGFLINKLKYNENSIIADFYTRQNGENLGNNIWWHIKKR